MSDDCGSATIGSEHHANFGPPSSPHGSLYLFPPNHSKYVDITMNLTSAISGAPWSIFFNWFDSTSIFMGYVVMPGITGTSGTSFLHYGSFVTHYPSMAQFAFTVQCGGIGLGVPWAADIDGTVVFLDCDEPTGGGVGTLSNMVTILG